MLNKRYYYFDMYLSNAVEGVYFREGKNLLLKSSVESFKGFWYVICGLVEEEKTQASFEKGIQGRNQFGIEIGETIDGRNERTFDWTKIVDVLGLIITNLTVGWPSTIIALRRTRNKYNITINWASSAKILLSSATAFAATYRIISIIPLNDWMKLIIGAIIFTAVLVMVTLLTRTIDRTDINNLQDMLTELGPFGGLFNFLLKIIEKLITALQP